MKHQWMMISAAMWMLSTSGGYAKADEFEREPFGLRLLLALNRASNYTTNVGQVANFADPHGSSRNPAADDVLRDADGDDDLTLTFTSLHAVSDSGAYFIAEAATGSWSTAYGTFHVAYARTDSIESSTDDGFENPLRSNEFFFGSAHRLNDEVAVGWEGRIIDADIQEELLDPRIGFPTRTDASEFGGDLTLGVHWQFAPRWRLGVLANGGYSSLATEVKTLNTVPLGPPGGAIPAGTVLADDDLWRVSQWYGVGLAYQPVDPLTFYLDAQYAWYEIEDLGTAELGRFALGTDWRVAAPVSLRGGVMIDTEAEVSVGAGIRVRVADAATFEAAYQFNAFPEVEPEFDRFHLASVSLVVRF